MSLMQCNGTVEYTQAIGSNQVFLHTNYDVSLFLDLKANLVQKR